jgi:hypothetical protein
MRTIDEATGHHCNMRSICVRAVLVATAVAALVAGTVATAFAAGDPAVDQLIVTNALPGWTRIPDSALESTVASERSAIGTATTHAFQVGVEGWSRADQSVIVAMISFPNGDPPGDFRARDAVVGACGVATHSAPRDMQPYIAITGSTEARCTGTSSSGVAIDASVMSWQKDNVFAIVIGNQVPTADLETFALAQDEALPSSGPNPVRAKTDSNSNTGLFVIAGLAAVIGAAILWVVVARSRNQAPAPVQALSTPVGAAARSPYATPAPSPFAAPAPSPSPFSTAVPSPFTTAAPSPSASPAPTPSPFATAAPPTATATQAPGWQQVDGDPTRIAYWDGSKFTAWKRWDGSAWVE